jgi:D-cysteine desulfhydrase
VRTPASDELPLYERFPALRRVPRVALGAFPTPVERVAGVPGRAAPLWLKRDDLTAAEFGGNKVRALEFLLAPVRAGDTVLTVGGEGSTHVLATAFHAARLGARTEAVRWRHEMNDAALVVASRAAAACRRVDTSRWAAVGLARAAATRLARRVVWVPAGGTSPLGMLGHVNAALELAHQVARGELPAPSRVVVPLGSGGTMAGLALGFAAAGLHCEVVGARVVSRVVANRRRVLALAAATARLIARLTGERPPPLPARERLRVVHEAYGGAYGRETPAGRAAAAALREARGLPLDATYGAKALAVALELVDGETLFWLTFDARWMTA